MVWSTSQRLGDARCLTADRKAAPIAIVENTINAATSRDALAADNINWSRLPKVAWLAFCNVCDTAQ